MPNDQSPPAPCSKCGIETSDGYREYGGGFTYLCKAHIQPRRVHPHTPGWDAGIVRAEAPRIVEEHNPPADRDFGSWYAKPCSRCGALRNYRVDGQMQVVCFECASPTPPAAMEMSDAERLRYIAENPEVLCVLYDLFGDHKLKAGHDPLDAMRDVLDEQREQFPTGSFND